jgi:hypothetical protein
LHLHGCATADVVRQGGGPLPAIRTGCKRLVGGSAWATLPRVLQGSLAAARPLVRPGAAVAAAALPGTRSGGLCAVKVAGRPGRRAGGRCRAAMPGGGGPFFLQRCVCLRMLQLQRGEDRRRNGLLRVQSILMSMRQRGHRSGSVCCCPVKILESSEDGTTRQPSLQSAAVAVRAVAAVTGRGGLLQAVVWGAACRKACLPASREACMTTGKHMM